MLGSKVKTIKRYFCIVHVQRGMVLILTFNRWTCCFHHGVVTYVNGWCCLDVCGGGWESGRLPNVVRAAPNYERGRNLQLHAIPGSHFSVNCYKF